MRRLAAARVTPRSRLMVLVAVGCGLVLWAAFLLGSFSLPAFPSPTASMDESQRTQPLSQRPRPSSTTTTTPRSPVVASSPLRSVLPSASHSPSAPESPSSLPSPSASPSSSPSASSSVSPSRSPSPSSSSAALASAPPPSTSPITSPPSSSTLTAPESTPQAHPPAYGNGPPPSMAWAPRVAARCELGKFVTAGPWAKDCIPDERVLEETQLRFPPFVLPMPRFVSPKDRQWFVKLAVVQEYINSSLECFKRPPPPGVLCPLLDSHTSPDDVLVFWNDKYVTGKNLVLANGSFGQYEGCSWSTQYDTYLKKYPSFASKTPQRWNKLAPMIVVQGWSFQHLIDGVLPRLMQAWEGLQGDPNITVLVDYNLAKFPVVQKIWEHLLPADRLVVFDPFTIFQGTLWYQSCQSPPFHPYLWKKMRERFGYRELPFADRNTIVYLGRGKRSGQTYNSGRSVINEDQLIDRLEAFIALRNQEREAAGQADKLELVVFNHADFATLQETIAFFNRAKVLIGPHGGSFYNLLYTPSQTLTIEFMPYNEYSKPNLIIWQQAVMLDHTYYLLPYPAEGGNLKVNVSAIADVLEREIPA